LVGHSFKTIISFLLFIYLHCCTAVGYAVGGYQRTSIYSIKPNGLRAICKLFPPNTEILTLAHTES